MLTEGRQGPAKNPKGHTPHQVLAGNTPGHAPRQVLAGNTPRHAPRQVLAGNTPRHAPRQVLAGNTQSHTPRQVLALFGYGGVQAATDRQVAGYRRIFGFLDADRDGLHSRQEYVEDGTFMNLRARQGIFAASDCNDDGFVSEAEYVENRIITDAGRAIFFEMDANRDDRLTAQEIVASRRFQDERLAEDAFKALDTNGDGELVLPEYLRVWGRWARS